MTGISADSCLQLFATLSNAVGAGWRERGAWLAPVGLGILALSLRLAQLDQAAHIDELYHLLAARSWLAEGEFRIAEGTYGRAPLFTILLAGGFALFGESLAVARLPSALAGSLMVVALFLWTRREAGAPAAWGAALLLTFWSEAIELSQFARFYALHGLLVFAAAIAVYALVEPHRTWSARAGLVLVAALAFVLALELQITTLIALAGVGLWGALTVVLPWLRRRRNAWVWAGGLGAAALVALVATVAVAHGTDFVAGAWDALAGSPLWSARQADRVWFYHGLFSVSMPLLWALAGMIALFALAHRPRPALFCLVLFATAFLIHSIAARKNVRYVFYAMPFLFVLAGIAAQVVLPRVWAALVAAAGQATAAVGVSPRARLSATLATLACAFALAAQPDLIRGLAGQVGVHLPPERPRPQWGEARAALEPWLERADVVLVADELSALYYLDRYDLLISKSRLTELHEQGQFARDFRTGRRIISTPEAVAQVMNCFEDGLVIASEDHWRGVHHLDDAVADQIVRRAEAIPLPAGGRMRAYTWQRDTAPPPERCADLPALPGPSAAG